MSAGGAFTYDPGSVFQSLGVGESATDSFAYTVSDIAGAAATATVSITVAGVNDAPVAVADAGDTDEDTPATIDVLANDTTLTRSAQTHTVDRRGRRGLVFSDQAAWVPRRASK